MKFVVQVHLDLVLHYALSFWSEQLRLYLKEWNPNKSSNTPIRIRVIISQPDPYYV